MNYLIVDTPIGKLTLAEENDKLVQIIFNDPTARRKESPTPILKATARQLAEYFNGERQKFDLPIAPKGTEFQKKVWQAIKEIPYGQTKTYGQLAKELDHPRAMRAVGGASHANPIPIVIPCHRVVAKNSLGGFGLGVEIKKTLLELECLKLDF